MRDVIFFILILAFSASAASFAPSSANIGSSEERPMIQPIMKSMELSAPRVVEAVPLRESLGVIESRCDSLEEALRELESESPRLRR